MPSLLAVPTGVRRSSRGRSPSLARGSALAGLLVAAVVGGAASVDLRTASIAVVVVLAAIFVVDRPVLGGLAVVAIVPATSGMAPGLPMAGMRPSEALVLGVGGLFLLLPLRAPRPWGRLDWTVAAYCVGSIALAAFNEVRIGTGGDSWIAVIAPVQHLLLFRIVATTMGSRSSRAMALRVLLLASIPVSVVGILQQLDIGPFRDLVRSATGGGVFDTWVYANYPRATSVFPNWHAFGGYLVVVILVGLTWLASDPAGVPRRTVGLALGSGAAALALTQTFTSILAVGFGALLVLNRTRAWALARWVLLLAAATVALFGSYLGGRLDQQWASSSDGGLLPQTIDYRIEVWSEQYLPLIGRYWPLGYGTGTPPGVEWVYTESGYLTLLLRGGLPLLVLGVVLLGRAYATADRTDRTRTGIDRTIALCTLVLALALMPMNLVWPYLSNSGLSQGFFVLLGLLSAVDAQAHARGDVPAPAPGGVR